MDVARQESCAASAPARGFRYSSTRYRVECDGHTCAHHTRPKPTGAPRTRRHAPASLFSPLCISILYAFYRTAERERGRQPLFDFPFLSRPSRPVSLSLARISCATHALDPLTLLPPLCARASNRSADNYRTRAFYIILKISRSRIDVNAKVIFPLCLSRIQMGGIHSRGRVSVTGAPT